MRGGEFINFLFSSNFLFFLRIFHSAYGQVGDKRVQ